MRSAAEGSLQSGCGDLMGHDKECDLTWVTREGAATGPGGQLWPWGAGTGNGRSTVWLGGERGVRGLGR